MAGEAAPRTPILPSPASPPRTGLLASARRPDLDPSRANERWQNGFSWEPEKCNVDLVVALPCSGGTDNKPTTANAEIRQYDPVALIAHDRCSTFGFKARDWEGRARRSLACSESAMLARELWEGNAARAASPDLPNSYFASNEAQVLTTSSVPIGEGIACLEDNLASCGCGRKMIHVTPATMIGLATLRLVTREGNIFVTANDTIVVADAGYSGMSPDRNPAVDGAVWAYGTDIIDVRLDPDIMITPGSLDDAKRWAAATDRAANTVVVRAERLAAASFDGCCLLAVRLDVPVCDSEAAS